MHTLDTLSLAFTGLAYVFYVRAILKSDTRPTISSWVSWLLMDAAIFAAMKQSGTFSVQMLTFVVGSAVVISVCLIKQASVGWRRLDTICVGIVALAMVMWAATGSAKLAILLSIVAAVVGSIPMLINTWKEPHNEALTPWVFVLIGTTCALFGLDVWTFESSSAQFTFVVLQVIFLGLIVRKYFPQATVA